MARPVIAVKGRAGIVTALGIGFVGALLGLAGLSDVDQDQIEQDIDDEW